MLPDPTANDEATRAAEPRSPRAWLRKIDWRVACLILAVKVLVLGFAALGVRTMTDDQPGFEQMWLRWDAMHYRMLAESGYASTGEQRDSIVFYPMYPWFVRAISFVARDVFISTLIASAIASIAAGLLLQRLARLDAPAPVARQAVWFLFIFPTSYFLHIGYTESLFLTFLVGCVLAARLDCWAIAGALGACACFTRVNGLILIPTLAVEALHQYRLTKRIDWRWLWIGVVGLGFLGYLALNYYVTGDPFAFQKIMEVRWYKKFTPPWRGITDVWLRIPYATLAEGLYEFAFIVLGFLCTVWCWVRLRPSYAVWMTLNWLLITSTAFVLSVPRYLLTFFPMFILFAVLSAKRPLIGMLLTAASLLFLALFATRFAYGTWAF